MTAPPNGVFLDERPPDPTWWSPAEAVVPATGPRRPHPLLLGVGVLALVLTLLWVLGGFQDRTDLRIVSRAGALVATGPYEFAFTRATAQRVNRFGDEYVVQVFVYGTGRTTGDSAESPSTLSPMFWAYDQQSREIHAMEGQRFGPGATFGHGSSFTPGLPPQDYVVTFEFTDAYRPGSSITFAVAELEFSDTSLLGTGEKTWNNADQRYVMQLPLTRLPDEE